MSLDYLPGSTAADVAGSAIRTRPPALALCIDWRAARQADRSCCCPAKPRVVAIVPPAPDRPEPADLLLCWHHYRVSRAALAAAGAVIIGIDGAPVPDTDWPPPAAESAAGSEPAPGR